MTYRGMAGLYLVKTSDGGFIRAGLVVASLLCASGPAAKSVFAEGAGPGAAPVLRLGAAVSAVISEIGVRDHEMVQAGQVLLTFDCKPLEAEIKLREANLEAAQAAYERTRNGPRPDEVVPARPF